MSADCAVLASLPVTTSLAGCCNQGAQVVCTNGGRVTSLLADVAAPNLSALIDGVARLPALTSLTVRVTGGRTVIPQSIGSLTNLQNLTMANCNLTSPIPISFGSLTNLKSLNLSRNFFSEPFSSLDIDGKPSLVSIDISYNDFIGFLSLNRPRIAFTAM
ncbi:hypothetical protein HK105_209444 [Polyrhizophydium stewartii]|uniref:Uncharacterized protein n=1 Tax=Polyrhizophydium stewartii TaxID=2732419 RepID=A0ABR4MV85_9FUNG